MHFIAVFGCRHGPGHSEGVRSYTRRHSTTSWTPPRSSRWRMHSFCWFPVSQPQCRGRRKLLHLCREGQGRRSRRAKCEGYPQPLIANSTKMLTFFKACVTRACSRRGLPPHKQTNNVPCERHNVTTSLKMPRLALGSAARSVEDAVQVFLSVKQYVRFSAAMPAVRFAGDESKSTTSVFPGRCDGLGSRRAGRRGVSLWFARSPVFCPGGNGDGDGSGGGGGGGAAVAQAVAHGGAGGGAGFAASGQAQHPCDACTT